MTGLPRPGASYLGGGRCHFSVWVPDQRSVEVVLLGAGDGGATRVVSLEPLTFGHHAGIVERVAPGQWYKIRIGGVDFPDLASRSQPEGVHGASEIIDPPMTGKTANGWAFLCAITCCTSCTLGLSRCRAHLTGSRSISEG